MPDFPPFKMEQMDFFSRRVFVRFRLLELNYKPRVTCAFTVVVFIAIVDKLQTSGRLHSSETDCTKMSVLDKKYLVACADVIIAWIAHKSIRVPGI
jgi:hypothetical protein